MKIKAFLFILTLLILISSINVYASSDISYSAQALMDIGLIEPSTDSEFFSEYISADTAINSLESLFGKELFLSAEMFGDVREQSISAENLAVMLLEGIGLPSNNGVYYSALHTASEIGFFDGFDEKSTSYDGFITYDDFCKVILNCLLIKDDGINVLPESFLHLSGKKENFVFYWQNNPLFLLPKSEGCYITSIAMALASQGRDITPYDIYVANGNSTYADYGKLSECLSCDISVLPKTEYSALYEIFKENPLGTVITFSAENFSHAVFITDIDENGNIICNDPAFENGGNLPYEQTWMARKGITTDNIKSIILINNK